MRSAWLAPCLLMWASGCTADPIARGLLVTSPHAEAAVVRHHADRVEVQRGPEAADDANARAVRSALRGDYERALQQMPAPSTASRPITRTVVRSNRDVVAYWKQRKLFAGSLALPDPRVGFGVSADTTSLSAPDFHRRFGRLTQTFEVDAGGLRLRLPYETLFEEGSRDAFRGETQITLQAFAGKASVWPDTKLTAGVLALVHRSAACTATQEGRADLFLGAAHRYGRLAATVVIGVPTDPGTCPGPCLIGGDLWLRTDWNLLVHHFVQPTFGASAGAWFADARGALLSLSPGVRVFLDQRQTIRLDAVQHTTVGEVRDVVARRVGAELSIAYRWW